MTYDEWISKANRSHYMQAQRLGQYLFNTAPSHIADSTLEYSNIDYTYRHEDRG